MIKRSPDSSYFIYFSLCNLHIFQCSMRSFILCPSSTTLMILFIIFVMKDQVLKFYSDIHEHSVSYYKKTILKLERES